MSHICVTWPYKAVSISAVKALLGSIHQQCFVEWPTDTCPPDINTWSMPLRTTCWMSGLSAKIPQPWAHLLGWSGDVRSVVGVLPSNRDITWKLQLKLWSEVCRGTYSLVSLEYLTDPCPIVQPCTYRVLIFSVVAIVEYLVSIHHVHTYNNAYCLPLM